MTGAAGRRMARASPTPPMRATRRISTSMCRTSPAACASACSAAPASSAVSGFRPDGAQLALLHDRGYGDMSLLLLDLASGEAHEFPQPTPSNYQSVRWASDGRTLLALTDHGGSDFMRLCRLDPDSGAVTVVYQAPGRDVEAWAISPDATQLATVENDRGYAVLRVGPIGGERPVVTGLPRGVVTEPTFAPDGTTLAFTVAAPTLPPSLWLWRDGTARPLWQPETPIDPAQLRRSRAGGVAELRRHSAFPAGWRCRAATMPDRGYPAIIWVHGGPVGTDAAELPPRHPDAAGAGLRRAAAERARQFRLWPPLHRKRRRQQAARQRDGPGARPALARRASGNRCRAHRHHGPVVRRVHGAVRHHRTSRAVARRGELLRHRRFRHPAGGHRSMASATIAPRNTAIRTATRNCSRASRRSIASIA